MEPIGAKTFASQFIDARESRIYSAFQRNVRAVKNGKVQLLHHIAQNNQQLFEKDEKGKNLLFYAVYQKQPSTFLYLLIKNLPYNQPDSQNKNLYHLCAYYGSEKCLQTYITYIKYHKLSKMNERFLQILQKSNYKRTDAKNGQLKYPVSPNRLLIFKSLQKEIIDLYSEYLQNYLQENLKMMKSNDDVDQRNPLHLVCLNKYQKCFITLQIMFKILQQPDIMITENTFSEYQNIGKLINQKLDPRLYVDLLTIMKTFIAPQTLNEIHLIYQKQLKKGIKQLLEAKDKDQQTPLYIASKNGSTKMINCLKRYAPKTKEDDKKQIMKIAGNNLARSHIIDLCEASTLSDTKPLSYLLSCGQNIDNKKTIFGTFALLEAVKSFKTDKNLEPVKQLLKNGADVNIQDTNGWTVIHHAAYSGQKQIIELLYSDRQKLNLNLNKLTNKRLHALHLAAISNHSSIIQFLVEECKVKIDIVDWDGCTAIHHAAKKGSFQALKMLIELGADIYATDNLKMTVLHHASASNSEKCVKYVLTQDSDKDTLRDLRNSKNKKAKDLTYNTSMFDNIFTAARNGNTNTIRKLILNDSELKDQATIHKNRTPLIIAVISQQLGSVKFLLQSGADTYHEDSQGKSAENYAQQILDKLLSQKKSNKDQLKIAKQIKQAIQNN